MTERLVNCSKYKEPLPGLKKPPFPGELGQKIFENVSEKAWLEWRNDLQIKVLNEYRLNMANPEHYKVLMDQMLRYLNLSEGEVAEVENATRGRQGT